MTRIFRNRNFALYFAGRAVSVVGDSFYSVALILAVVQATHSVTSGAMVLIASTVPVIILTLVGGTLGDRLPRNRIMLSSDLVRSMAQFVIAALLLRSNPPLWALLMTQVCYGAGEALFDPASTGLLPEIVASEELPAANSALQLLQSGALVVGPALAGIVIAFAGAALAIALDAASFLASAISLAFVHVPRGNVSLGVDSMLAQLRTGFVEMRRRRWVLVTACYLVVLAFAFNGTIFALGPAVALSRLGGPSAWSLLLSTFGIGVIAGSFAARRVLQSQRALGWSYVGNFGLIPLLALLGTSHSTWVVVSSGVAGVAVAIFSTTYPTLLQQTIPAAVLSRVGSYFWLARVAATPLAFAFVGPLSAQYGIPAVFIVAASLIALSTLGALAFPEIWSLRARAEPA